jgi:hypothetical protein
MRLFVFPFFFFFCPSAVMRRAEQMRFQALPGTTGDNIPLAAAAFNCPEFISGWWRQRKGRVLSCTEEEVYLL